MKKFFLYSFILAIIGAACFAAYIYFSESGKRDPFSVIPDDAIYIIETKNLTDGWEKLRESKMWVHLLSNPKFEDINKSALSLDSLINDNSTMNMLLSDRKMLVSSHMVSETDYDFVFVINVQKASKISYIKDYIKGLLGYYEYSMSKRDYKGQEIMVLTDEKTKDVIQLAFIENLLVCTFSPVLIEKCLDQKDDNYWAANIDFQNVAREIKSRKLFNFYFNFNQLKKYMKCYLGEESDIVNSIARSLTYSAFNVYFEDEQISFNGYSNPDSIPSYIKSISEIDPGKMKAHEIISDKAALYFSICFDEFPEFQEKLTELFSRDSVNYESYNKMVDKIEKLLKINLQQDFFSWIGNEVSFVKLQPTANAKENDVIITFHADDIEKAKEGLGHICRQIKRRLPAKFEAIEYQNYEIQQFRVRGFFKLIFGKMIKKMEKPYFTFIDDFVVFSNSSSALIEMIDDYTNEKTLSHNKKFMDFKDEFSNKANMSIFIQMPKIYSHLYYYGKSDKKNDIKKNKHLILSFTRIGFQLQKSGDLLKTTLIADFDEDALYNSELEKFEASAEDLNNKEYESLSFKIELSDSELDTEGEFTKQFLDSTLKYEGNINDKQLNGLWKSYYESGNIKSAVMYKEGKIEGTAMFYYDEERSNIMAKVDFEDEEIANTYREFYKNGSRKASIDYNDGETDGKAEFYYNSGSIKISGKYKNGEKKGKWKYYTETGEIFDKEKFKKQKK